MKLLLECAAKALSGVNQWDQELTPELRHRIEAHWRPLLFDRRFDEDSDRQKMFVLAMFPYPSGKLHMGHVRVYTISDAIARFHRMTGKNVLHPMGWDAFGLPAENAALDRDLDPDSWTQDNIASMKDHMEHLGLSFDWSREFATCDSDYYKWTQFLFLKLYENDMVYQKEAMVNWDPVDQTVLADEQVDKAGRSWRSGAKVERRMLKQWFVRTTRFSKRLYHGLDDPELLDWKDIVKLQKHWIGECDGTTLELEVVADDQTARAPVEVWTRHPEHIDSAAFVAVRPSPPATPSSPAPLPYRLKNPFTNDLLPAFVTDAVDYPEGCDVHLGMPGMFEKDMAFAKSVNLPVSSLKAEMTEAELTEFREKVCAEARQRGIGGHATSSKLRDWLISRQRYWGTPIPMVYCRGCGGPWPVPEAELPVRLPAVRRFKRGPNPLAMAAEWRTTTCPKCGGPADRETDTMDTFVDSSWYFLRYIDPDNTDIPFRPDKAKRFMPVDVYVGGKEHAVLHLYYARFLSHFLHSAGLLPHPEPFKRLLVQGMVRGRTFRSKATGEYVKPEMATVEKNVAFHKETKEPLVMAWEKMSKSKHNGVDPVDMFEELGTDATRLILLADVAPTSSRNWTRDTFPGVLNWQHRLWLTLQSFQAARRKNLAEPPDRAALDREDEFLFDSRNFYLKGVTFNFLHSYQLSVAISKMQGLTNSLRKVGEVAMALSPQFERCLAAQIILLAPMAPHFASELWAGFLQAPNRLGCRGDVLWDRPVLLQPWPRLDATYRLPLVVRVNGAEVAELKMAKSELDKLTHDGALRLAMKDSTVLRRATAARITNTYFKVQKDYDALLTINTERGKKAREREDESEDLQGAERKGVVVE